MRLIVKNGLERRLSGEEHVLLFQGCEFTATCNTGCSESDDLHTHIHTHSHSHVHTHTHIHSHTLAHTYSYTHTLIHTHTIKMYILKVHPVMIEARK